MNKERDIHLSTIMGIKYHEVTYGDGSNFCHTCSMEMAEDDPYIAYHQNIDFTTWDGFGKLFEWAVKQIWWSDFIDCHGVLDCNCGCGDGSLAIHFIKPKGNYNFPDEVYEYLTINMQARKQRGVYISISGEE